jgi:hypothetical protein
MITLRTFLSRSLATALVVLSPVNLSAAERDPVQVVATLVEAMQQRDSDATRASFAADQQTGAGQSDFTYHATVGASPRQGRHCRPTRHRTGPYPQADPGRSEQAAEK